MMMKKKILSMVVLMSTSLCTFAQNGVGEWSFMPKVGLNLATMTNDDDAKTRSAFTVGGEFGYVASHNVALSFGAMYSQQGCKAKFQGIDGTIKMDYINVPVIAAYRVTDNLSVKVGLQPGFLINDKVKISSNGVTAEVGLEESYKSAGMDVTLNSFDLSIPIGISYDFDKIQLELRYNAGLTKVLSTPSGDGTKNSVIQFTIGYKLGL
jgi:long-subunit fatty acid transport protein